MASTFQAYSGLIGLPAPKVRKIGPNDCLAALSEGFDDFLEMPTYPAFIGIFYALGGIALAALSEFGHALHLVFPLAAGFALIGPFVAVGLYEMSRRRERGIQADWRDAFAVRHSPALPSALALGFFLFALFVVWIVAAELLYMLTYGPEAPKAALPFFRDVLTSGRGWMLIVLGGLIGFCFAAAALCISIVSFPLMLDRDGGVASAVDASLRLSRENPATVALWGLIVAVGLIVGSIPLFIGLAVVMPVLGHATWRFYRRAIEREPALELPVFDREAPEEPTDAIVRILQEPAYDTLIERIGRAWAWATGRG